MSSLDPKNVDKEFNTTTLVEDGFGTYWDACGKPHDIRRFTWRNRNKIQIQVINYGARIISMKVPDRKGIIEDIVLGFDDLAGYIFYQSHYFGATIGCTSQLVPNGTSGLNEKPNQLTQSNSKHQLNGGIMGLDQSVWDAHIIGGKVIMSYLSKQLSEGFPGNVLIRVGFQLSDMNEFKIDYEAFTTQPTVIDLSNLTYFNLAGHHKGADEIYKHIVMVNADCFLKQQNGIPTGEICNVANFPFDFQIPKVLGKLIGVSPGDGFKEYLCINRGTSQDNCFIGRLVHNPSGRVVEVYSNQRCVHFTTANDFGYGRVLSIQELSYSSPISCKSSEIIRSSEHIESEEDKQSRSIAHDEFIEFLIKLHGLLEESLQEDKENNYENLRDLIVKMGMKKRVSSPRTPSNTPIGKMLAAKSSAILELVLTDRQRQYLKGLYNAAVEEDSELWERLINSVRKLLRFSVVSNPKNSVVSNPKGVDSEKSPNPINVKPEIKTSTRRCKSGEINKNKIPTYYKEKTKIIGKERTIYRTHSGVALQTMNFPCSEFYKKFPSSILNPGENYKHTITYKFWIRAANPNKWIKKNSNELGKMT